LKKLNGIKPENELKVNSHKQEKKGETGAPPGVQWGENRINIVKLIEKPSNVSLREFSDK